MKYEGHRPSGKDKDIPVYIFAMGKDEIVALKSVLAHYYRAIPKTTETQSFCNRIRNIKKVFEASHPKL